MILNYLILFLSAVSVACMLGTMNAARNSADIAEKARDNTICVHFGEVYTIVEESGEWGKLKSGAGWIHLGYTWKLAGEKCPPPYRVRIKANILNVREGAGVEHMVATKEGKG